MKIGDVVYVRGEVDEIRKDVVIIKNTGGYFGTDKSEIVSGELRTKQDVDAVIDAVIDKMLEIMDTEYWKPETDDIIEYYERLIKVIKALKGGEQDGLQRK